MSFKKEDIVHPMINPLELINEEHLDIKTQQEILLCLPNHHKWPFPGVKELKHDQRFSSSCRRYPGSPRNRFIQAWNFLDNPYDIIYDILYNIYCGQKKVRYPEKRATAKTGTRKRKKTFDEVLGFLDSIKKVIIFKLITFYRVLNNFNFK